MSFIAALLLTPVISLLITGSNLFTAALGKRTGNLTGSCIHHFVGFCFGAIFIFIFQGFSLNNLSEIPAYYFLGGALGGVFIAISNYAIPKIGVASTLVLFISTQIIFSMLISHFAWFNALKSSFTFEKFIGAIFLIIGVYLILSKKHQKESNTNCNAV